MMGNITQILFVCHGNICRSPMAEFVMKDLLQKAGCNDDFLVSSVAVSTEEIGNDIYPPAKKKLCEKNIPFATRRARQISREDFRASDYVILMDKSNYRLLRYIVGEDVLDREVGKVSMLMEWAGENRDVADPWYTGDFEKAYQDILKGCQAFLKKIMKE